MKNNYKRRYDIDWIRDITVLSIIFYHSLIVFYTNEDSIMFVRSGYNLWPCIIVEAVLSRIMMPILFILAGFSAKYSLKNRSSKEYIINRVKKLLLPLIIVSFTLNPVVSYMYGLSQGRNISFGKHYYEFITKFSQNFNGLTTGYSPMHLWFLLYLFVFSIICLPIFSNHADKNIISEKSLLYKPGALVILVIPYTLIFAVDIMDEMNPIAYLFLFLLGFFIMTEDKFWEAIRRDKWIYFVMAVIMITGSLTGWFIFGEEATLFVKIPLIICVKGVRIIAPIAVMAVCYNDLLNRKSKVLLYLNGANFPIYLYHMFLLTSISYCILELHTNAWVKFILINIVTYLVAFLLYECYRRVSRILRKRREQHG